MFGWLRRREAKRLGIPYEDKQFWPPYYIAFGEKIPGHKVMKVLYCSCGLHGEKKMADNKPEWEQVLDLFARFGAPPPPTKLRDEIVGYRHALKEMVAAEDADHDQLRDAFQGARHALNLK